jgi:outer membrane protein assembly factor BamA
MARGNATRPVVLALLLAVAAAGPVRAEGIEIEPDGLYGVSLDGYNRVDGLPVTLGLRGSRGRVAFHLRAIYRIASERLGGRAGVSLRFLRERDVVAALEGHAFTDTNDRGRMGDFENSLSAFLFKEDFRNYYQRQGVSASIAGDLHPLLRARAAWTIDRYTSLARSTDFALFGWGKSFRPNPRVDEGWMGTLAVEIETDTRDDREQPSVGWFQRLRFEVADPALGGDFDFRRAEWTVRRYNRIGPGRRLDARFMGVWGSDRSPPQRGIHVHGVGGLRGRPDDFTPRARAFVASVEARLDLAKGLKRAMLFRDRLGLVFFADAGGFREPGPDGERRFDVDAGVGVDGAGILTYSGIFLALPIDDRGDGPRVTFRVRRDY